jgi:glucose/arabinose dehydrogenase
MEAAMTTTLLRALLGLGAAFAGAAACAQTPAAGPVAQGPKNVPEFEPAFREQTRAPEAASGVTLAVETVAEGLEHPWGMALLPDGALLVTERPGRLRVVAPDGAVSDPVAGIPEVHARNQGGLLDVAVGPDFAEERLIYWTYAKPLGDGLSATAAARGRLAEDLSRVTDVEDIFVQRPASPTSAHYGSRVLFESPRTLYVTTGEHRSAGERVLAQSLDAGYGKVIRIRPDGSAPPDNPFVGEPGALEAIWSFGHRNIQGADIDQETGLLWTVEHGPQGGDELNVPQAGGNYGWPVISYGEDYDGSPIGDGLTATQGMEQPVYYWDPVIAPGGMTFYRGTLFEGWRGDLLIASLTPGALVRLELARGSTPGETRVVGEERLLTDQGRIRDVAEAADGALLVLTDEDNGALLRLTPDGATTN